MDPRDAKPLQADDRSDLTRLEQAVETALRRSKALGNSACEAAANLHRGLAVNVRQGEVETLEQTRDRGLSITVYRGHCKATASSGDLREATILECVERATDIARHTQADNCNGLPDPALLASEFPDLDLWHPERVSAETAIERALAVEAAALDFDTRISNSEGGSFSWGEGLSVLGNSEGFLGSRRGTRFGQSAAVIAGNGNAMQRDYWYDSRRAMADLDSPEATGIEAARRTLARLGARAVPTCQVPVLFSPEVARSLIGHFVAAISGGNLYRRSSFLLDSLGQQVFPEFLQLSEQPLAPRGPASAAFDGEGVATRNAPLVEDGKVSHYVLGSYAARRLGLASTGNAGGVRNLQVADSVHGSQPLAELLRRMGRGLLVNEFMGQGVSLVTGDYSRGAAGFWVENGEISHPVQEVTIAGKLGDMLAGILAVGDDVETRSSIQTGSILVDRMTVAGS